MAPDMLATTAALHQRSQRTSSKNNFVVEHVWCKSSLPEVLGRGCFLLLPVSRLFAFSAINARDTIDRRIKAYTEQP